MWYHAIGYYGAKQRYWWNRKRDDLIQEIIVPFISKQVRILTREGTPSLFNFAAADYITIIKTEDKLTAEKGKMPTSLRNAQFVYKHCATKEFVEEMQMFSSSPRVKSLLEQVVAPLKKQIFVVMKLADEQLDSAYTGVIKPLGESFGYNVLRVDEIQNGGSINQQILEELSSSAIVLADLSGERPNCYYEAGFAHAIGKEIIFSIKDGTTIHFDLASNRFITWRTEAEYRRKLRERLESIIAKDGA